MTLVVTDLDVGGAERALVALATGLDRRRWAPRVVALGGRGALVSQLEAAGIPVVCLDVVRTRPVQAIRRLSAELRRHPPRLIQSFLFHANVASRLAALPAHRPVVVAGIRVAEREKSWHLLLERLTQSLCAGAVCVSSGVARLMEAHGWPRSRLVVIPNGIDLKRWETIQPSPRRILVDDETCPITLYAGRIEAQKDLPTLLEAARFVASTLPDWRLLIVGDGPDRVALQRLCNQDEILHKAVRWLGFRSDLPQLLKAVDLLVLPSKWEGMPNVVLEAMAAGRAVVATAVEGTEDLVLPGETGWLVPVGDSQRLAEAILEASKDDNERNRRGKAGYRRAAEHFTAEAVVQRYDALWSALLGYEEANGTTVGARDSLSLT